MNDPKEGQILMDFDTLDAVRVCNVHKEDGDVDVKFLGEGARSLGMATMDIEELSERFEIP